MCDYARIEEESLVRVPRRKTNPQSVHSLQPDSGTHVLINSRCSSSATLLGWWLKLHHVGAELEVVAAGVLVLLGLLDLALLLGDLLEGLLVLSLLAHLGLVLLLVLADELGLLALFLAHVVHLQLGHGVVDQGGTLHEDIEVVSGEGMDLIIKTRVAKSLNQLDDDAGWLQRQKLALDGLIRFLQNSELLISWVLQDAAKRKKDLELSLFFDTYLEMSLWRMSRPAMTLSSVLFVRIMVRHSCTFSKLFCLDDSIFLIV